MAAGNFLFQANDGKIASVSFENGASSNVDVVFPKEGGTLANETYVESRVINKASGTRQTVQSASVDSNGFPNFITAGTGLLANIAATAVPIIVSAAGGNPANDRVGIINADTTVALTASTTNYIYISINADGSYVLNRVPASIAPVYQFGGTYSVANAQHTFNISDMKMTVGLGSSATQVWIVFLGEVVTDATSVVSVVNYALNGYYDSGWTNTLPGSAVQVTKSHNIGVIPDQVSFRIKCLTTDVNYAVNDVVDNVIATNGSVWSPAPTYKTNKIVGITSYNTAAPFALNNKTTGALASITNANWAYSFIVQRGW